MPVVIKKSDALTSVKQPLEVFHSVPEAANRYFSYGLQPVPLLPNSKKPAVTWSNYSFDPLNSDEEFGCGRGVAIRMGKSSGGLVDVDLDSATSRQLAYRYLPQTGCVFGRESASPGHFIYRTDGPITSKKFQCNISGKPVVFAEIRGDKLLTAFPPSKHTEGETVRFEQGKAGLPAQVDLSDLYRRVGWTSAGALLASAWPQSAGSRQELAMAAAGGMLRDGLGSSFVKDFIRNVAQVAGDEEATMRSKVVDPTLQKIEANEKTTGWPKVDEILGPPYNQIVCKCRSWLGVSNDDSLPTPMSGPVGKLEVVQASSIKTKPVEWFWEGYMPYGAITIIEGDPDVGKTTTCLDMAARQSGGLGLPDGSSCKAAGAVVLSCEDNLDTTVVPRLLAANADLKRVSLVGNVKLTNGSEKMVSIPEDLEHIRQLVIEKGAKLLIIEPLVAFLSPNVHSHNDQQVRQALGPLKTLAEETGIAVLAMRHLTKKTGPSAMHRGGGSIGIIGAARSALLVGKDPCDADYRVLAVTKSNLAKKPPSLRFQLQSKMDFTDEGQLWEAAAIEWCGVTDTTADALVSEVNHQDGGALHDAVNFLKELLAEGPKSQKQIMDQSKAEGISKATLNRAKKKLGVVSNQIHDGTKITGWEWSLPSDPKPT